MNGSTCPKCGAPLTGDAPEGLCPRCLLALNLAPLTEVTGERQSPGASASAKPAPPAPAEIAPHFPQLEILECLGRGGMGAVYKARQPRIDRLVALKILAPERHGDAQFTERFQREARALARLNHPNIVTVHDFGEAGGFCYLLMEYVEGVTLRHLLQQRKLAPAEALAIVPKICDALQFAHGKGVVHRDIKPENILLAADGQVKIADFGIAKLLAPGGSDLTLTGVREVVGTPHYMAPEQAEKPATVDHRADIFSLGVVFYEMLTGELPLGKFAPPSRKVQVDVRLDEVVLHALEKEPELRYQRASQVKTDLETIAGSPPAGPGSRAVPHPSVAHKGLGRALWLGAAVVILLGAGLAWWWNHRMSSTAPVLTDFSPKSAVVRAAVTLTGKNFSPVAASNVVYFGAVRATVTAASATSLTVAVPTGATYGPITVTAGGLTAVAKTAFTPTFAGSGLIGALNFAPRVNLPAGGGPMSTVMADFDGDGKTDLAVINFSSHLVTLYRNVSASGAIDASSFVNAGQLETAAGGEGPTMGLSADLDGDGRLDLLVVDPGTSVISTFRNHSTPGALGANSFAPRIGVAVGARPLGATVGDVDGDGRLDLLSINANSGTVSVLRGIGTPGQLSFAPSVDFTVAPNGDSVQIADLDGDGKPEIMAIGDTMGSEMSVLRNLSSPGTLTRNSFAPDVRFPLPPRAQAVRTGDLDGDGKLDVLVTSYGGEVMCVFRNVSKPGAFGLNSLAPRVDFALGGRGHRISLGDLNGDSKLDVFVETEFPSHLALFQNLSAPGSFTASSFAPRVDLSTGNNAWGSSVGDLDGDGCPDLVFASQGDDIISIRRNLGTIPPHIAQQPSSR